MPKLVFPQLILVASSLAVTCFCGCNQVSQAGNEPPLPMVEVVVAEQRSVPETVERNGKTRSLNEVSIRARVRGVLEEVAFKEGQDIVAGATPQLLFRIEKAPFEAKLASAKAKLAEAEAEREQAKDSKKREIATAQLAVDQAVLSLNQIEEARQRALFSRAAASREDLDRAVANRQRSAAQVDFDKANLDQAKVDYDINIKTADAHVLDAQAQVDEAQIDLDYCTIYAPINGRIGEAKVKVGNLVGPMTNSTTTDYTELATIEQLEPMGVDIQVPSRFLERATRLVRQGLKVNLVRPGAQSENPRIYTGESYFIDNKIDPKTSTVLVKASVGNPDATLLPGEYVKLDIVVGEIADAVLVPERAVIETQEGPTVYALDENDKVEIVPVQSTYTYDHMRVITSGLDPGRRVIVDGIQLVRAGQKTRPVLVGGTPDQGTMPKTPPSDNPTVKGAR